MRIMATACATIMGLALAGAAHAQESVKIRVGITNVVADVGLFVADIRG